MRMTTFLIAFYFLALNAFPCNDAGVVAADSQTEIVTAVGMDHGHNHTDLCPPFCTCHCCHVHTVDFGGGSFEPLVAEISSQVLPHSDRWSEEPIFSILQPPRA